MPLLLSAFHGVDEGGTSCRVGGLSELMKPLRHPRRRAGTKPFGTSASFYSPQAGLSEGGRGSGQRLAPDCSWGE